MTLQEYIYQKLTAAGMTKEGACAMLGNIQAESAFRPNNLEYTAHAKIGMTDEQYTAAVDNGTYTNFVRDGFGYGLFQVTFYTRKQMFLNYVRARNKSVGDYEVQVGYMIWELQSHFVKVWRELCSSNDLNELTKLVLYDWENPDQKEKKLSTRIQYATQWYQQFGSKGGSKGMTQNEAIKKVLDVARGEIGYHEQGTNVTKYAADLDKTNWYNGGKNGYAWCDVFVDWLFWKCFGDPLGRQIICQPTGSAGAGCLYSAQYYKDAGRWVSQPQPGDQIFFSYAAGEYSHTGIVETVANGMVNTIEGNTSDMVARRSYALASGSIVGYGRPKWDLASESTGNVDVDTDVEVPASTATSGYVSVILKKGSKGIDVRKYQEKLIELGYDLGSWGADGDFGNDTYKAVVQFQKDHNLDADGEIGPITSAAIEEALGGSTATNANTAPVQTSAGTIRPNQTDVVVGPVEQPTAKTSKFQVGDLVEFIGNGCYMSPNAKVGVACKQGRMIITAVNPAAKHPYRIRPMQRFTLQGTGWVDEDALQEVRNSR